MNQPKENIQEKPINPSDNYMTQEEHDELYPTEEREATPEDLELFPPELYSDN